MHSRALTLEDITEEEEEVANGIKSPNSVEAVRG